MRAIIILALVAVVSTVASASPAASLKDKLLASTDVSDDNNDLDNRLFYYDPILTKRLDQQPATREKNNVIIPLVDLERESSDTNQKANVAPSSINLGGKSSEPQAPNADKVKSIAFNSREVRLVGPDQKEVEMKDDVATKVVVVLENLQKEATEVWGQMNKKLDKGWTELKNSEVWGQVNQKLDKSWTDLKTMVEKIGQ